MLSRFDFFFPMRCTVIPEGKPPPLPGAPTHLLPILEQGEGQLLPKPALWDWVGNEEEDGANEVERREK